MRRVTDEIPTPCYRRNPPITYLQPLSSDVLDSALYFNKSEHVDFTGVGVVVYMFVGLGQLNVAKRINCTVQLG